MPAKISIKTELGTFLQGRPLGKKHFARLCELLSETATGEVIFLDFSGVEVVTGSWINEAIVPLLNWSVDDRTNLYPVLTNVSRDWLDDLQLVADLTHTCFLTAVGKLPKRGVLVGNLDSAQHETLDAVLAENEVTGAELERSRSDDGVKATAWNNRLKDLFGKRLLKRQKRGREQVYSPVISEIQIDG